MICSNIVRLLQLSKEVRQAIKEQKDISQGHARLPGPLKKKNSYYYIEKTIRVDLFGSMLKSSSSKKESQKET